MTDLQPTIDRLRKLQSKTSPGQWLGITRTGSPDGASYLMFAKPFTADDTAYLQAMIQAERKLLAAAEQSVKLRALLDTMEWDGADPNGVAYCKQCGMPKGSTGHETGCEWVEVMKCPSE